MAEPVNNEATAPSLNGEALPTLKDERLKTPKNVVQNEAGARTIFVVLKDANIHRALTCTRVNGMIDGNAPYKKAEMARKGLEHQTNINWRDGEARMTEVSIPFWSLFNDVAYLGEFTTDLFSPEQNPEVGRIVSEEWDYVMRQWPEFEDRMNLHQNELLKFGFNALLYIDKNDWMFDPIENVRFLFPEKTRNGAQYIEKCAVEHSMSPQALFEIYESDGESLWNKEAVAEVLYRCSLYAATDGDDSAFTTQRFVELQTKIRNGTVAWDSAYTSDIELVSILVREWDGQVSKMIIHPLYQTKMCLYYGDRLFEKMEDCVSTYSLFPGQRYMHGNKGFGHQMFNLVEGVNRLDCTLFDSARAAATVLISTPAGRNKDLKVKRFDLGGIVDIGEAEYKQNLLGANLAPSVQVSEYFQSKLARNNVMTGLSPRDLEKLPASGQRAQATKEGRIQKNVINHYYHCGDSHIRQMVIKQLRSTDGDNGYKYVELWKERCIARGVPKEFFDYSESSVGIQGLPKHMNVRMSRANGSGSQTADQLEMDEMMNMLPVLGERGRNHVLEDKVSSVRGFRYVARYLPVEDRAAQPTSEDTWASIENNQLEKGEQVIVSPDNNHAVHAVSHTDRLKRIAQAYREGAYSLQDTDTAFQTTGPHLTRHLLFLDQDPTRKALAQDLRQQWAILANFGDMIANNAQEEREAELRRQQKQQAELEAQMARGGPNDPEMVKVLKDAEIKTVKLKAEIERASLRDSLKFILERQKQSFDQELTRAKEMSKLASERAKTVNDITNTNLKSKGESTKGSADESEQVNGKERSALV